MRIPCIQCKGRNPSNCSRSFCPITAKYNALFKVKNLLKSEDFFGSSPAPFIGRFGYSKVHKLGNSTDALCYSSKSHKSAIRNEICYYPDINVGILSPPEQRDDAWLYDAPLHWASNDFAISQIVDLRSSLINSRFKANIKQQNRFLEISQEVGMASKPVDVEINLEKRPFFRLTTDAISAPMGPSASLKNMSITSNPKVHTKVDKVVSDTDLLANPGLVYLYKSGFDENFLSKLLSVGVLGKKLGRKLVPTRFSITAVDDMLGKQRITEIKEYPVSEYLAFFGGYLGNYYLILFFPEVWSYELFETYLPKASWNKSSELKYSTDYESCAGRKEYASSCAGGYYANRLPILEKLSALKQQASVLSLRFITEEYALPLGVWVCRESTRKALQGKPITFASKELLLSYAKKLIKLKFGVDLQFLLDKSELLQNFMQQKKLAAYF